ncbi:tetraspanin-1 [Takifugu flavidus]|uniref:tetraspanin-1 n=1 Tax=Takifugu flavidus TaxID=433684 RepID=UPI00254430B0|nr:tetraspanin-1 [Takifugu flavidus]
MCHLKQVSPGSSQTTPSSLLQPQESRSGFGALAQVGTCPSCTSFGETSSPGNTGASSHVCADTLTQIKMGCFTFVKLMMFFFNLLIFLGGLTLLAMGIWVSVDGGSFLQLLGPFSRQGMQFVNVGFFCIAIGAVLVLLGLLGCWGAHKESRCLLLVFFSIILIIFVAEVAAGVVALAYSSFAEGILRAWATPALKDDYGSDPVVTKIWNTTMMELKCCGFTNYTDFVGSKFEKENQGNLPPSCCWTNSSPCRPGEAQRSNVQGCFQQILEILKEHANIVGGIAAGIGVLEITAMTVSLYLYCHLDKRIS